MKITVTKHMLSGGSPVMFEEVHPGIAAARAIDLAQATNDAAYIVIRIEAPPLTDLPVVTLPSNGLMVHSEIEQAIRGIEQFLAEAPNGITNPMRRHLLKYASAIHAKL